MVNGQTAMYILCFALTLRCTYVEVQVSDRNSDSISAVDSSSTFFEDLTHNPEVCRAYGVKTCAAVCPAPQAPTSHGIRNFRLESLGPVLNCETV